MFHPSWSITTGIEEYTKNLARCHVYLQGRSLRQNLFSVTILISEVMLPWMPFRPEEMI